MLSFKNVSHLSSSVFNCTCFVMLIICCFLMIRVIKSYKIFIIRGGREIAPYCSPVGGRYGSKPNENMGSKRDPLLEKSWGSQTQDQGQLLCFFRELNWVTKAIVNTVEWKGIWLDHFKLQPLCWILLYGIFRKIKWVCYFAANKKLHQWHIRNGLLLNFL